MEAGYHSVVWNADSHASGMYFVKMEVGSIKQNIFSEYVATQKILFIK